MTIQSPIYPKVSPALHPYASGTISPCTYRVEPGHFVKAFPICFNPFILQIFGGNFASILVKILPNFFTFLQLLAILLQSVHLLQFQGPTLVERLFRPGFLPLLLEFHRFWQVDDPGLFPPSSSSYCSLQWPRSLRRSLYRLQK